MKEKLNKFGKKGRNTLQFMHKFIPLPSIVNLMIAGAG